jgi:hypothetical protein
VRGKYLVESHDDAGFSLSDIRRVSQESDHVPVANFSFPAVLNRSGSALVCIFRMTLPCQQSSVEHYFLGGTKAGTPADVLVYLNYGEKAKGRGHLVGYHAGIHCLRFCA